MTNKIDILVVEPGKAPRTVQAEDTLEAFQEIVGGPIEAGCYLPQRVMLVCNGEGKNLGLPLNRANPRAKDVIAGTFFLCGFEGERFTSLTAAQREEFQSYFARPGEFMAVGRDTVCVSPGELAAAACGLWEGMKSGESVTLTKWGGREGGGSK